MALCQVRAEIVPIGRGDWPARPCRTGRGSSAHPSNRARCHSSTRSGSSRSSRSAQAATSRACSLGTPSRRAECATPCARAAAATLAARISPTSSPRPTRAPRASASTTIRSTRTCGRRRLEIDDVRRHLHLAMRKPKPERLDTRQPPGRLADRGGNLLRDRQCPVQLEVEGEKRRPHADEHRARPRIEDGWPVRGQSSPASSRRTSSANPPRR